MTSESVDIPLFPLNVVLFPGGLLPLRIFEVRYMDMARDCMRANAPFGVCLIRDGREVGAPAEPEAVGCLARIVEWDMQQLGLLLVTARGEGRFRIMERRIDPNGLARARVELLPEEIDSALPAAFEACPGLLRRVVAQHGPKLFAEPHRFESAAWVGARLAEILPVPLADKQKLMELDDPMQRIEILHGFLLEHKLAGG